MEYGQDQAPWEGIVPKPLLAMSSFTSKFPLVGSQLPGPVSCQKKQVILISLTLILAFFSTRTCAQIAKFIGGPQQVCLNQAVNYDTGPSTCNDSYWKVTYQDGTPVLDYQASICGALEHPYFNYNTSYITIRLQQTTVCQTQPFFYMYQNLPVAFKIPGRYTIKAVPRGRVESPLGSLCNDAQIDVYVGALPIANVALTGPTTVGYCGPVTYSIPNLGNVDYNWTVSSNLGFATNFQTTTTPTATFNLNAFTGYQCGTLTVSTVPRCAGELGQSKQFSICRGYTLSDLSPR